MLKHQLETKVLAIVDRVVAGQRVEDHLVELKAEWPRDHRNTARKIAGHANSASGQPVLWIIGVDEDNHAVPGVNPDEYCEWWNQVKRAFNELEPEVNFLNVPAHGVAISALLIETDRAPYVVKTDGTGQVSREVPYRVATGTESINRHQLLKMLSRNEAMPKLELLQGKMRADLPASMGGIGDIFTTTFEGTLILHQPPSHETYLFSHKSEVYVAKDTGERWGMGMAAFVSDEHRNATINGTKEIRIKASERSENLVGFIQNRAPIPTLHVRFWIDALEDTLSVSAPMQRVGGEPHQATWLMKSWQVPWR